MPGGECPPDNAKGWRLGRAQEFWFRSTGNRATTVKGRGRFMPGESKVTASSTGAGDLRWQQAALPPFSS